MNLSIAQAAAVLGMTPTSLARYIEEDRIESVLIAMSLPAVPADEVRRIVLAQGAEGCQRNHWEYATEEGNDW